MLSKVEMNSKKFSKHVIKLWQNGPTFFNVKSTKMLSFFPVAEAYGLIYHCPLSENSSFVEKTDIFQLDFKGKTRAWRPNWIYNHVNIEIYHLPGKYSTETFSNSVVSLERRLSTFKIPSLSLLSFRPICSVWDIESRNLDHVISCDQNLQVCASSGYQQALKCLFIPWKTRYLHLFIPLFWIYWSFLSCLFCVEWK